MLPENWQSNHGSMYNREYYSLPAFSAFLKYLKGEFERVQMIKKTTIVKVDDINKVDQTVKMGTSERDTPWNAH